MNHEKLQRALMVLFFVFGCFLDSVHYVPFLIASMTCLFGAGYLEILKRRKANGLRKTTIELEQTSSRAARG